MMRIPASRLRVGDIIVMAHQPCLILMAPPTSGLDRRWLVLVMDTDHNMFRVASRWLGGGSWDVLERLR